MIRTLWAIAVIAMCVCLPGTAGAAGDGAKRPPTSGGNNGNKGKKGKKGKKKKKKGPQMKGPFKKKKYPVQEIYRPLVLPDGMGEVGAGLTYSRVVDIDVVGIGADFSYGLADVVELGASAGLALAPDVALSPQVFLRGHYLAYDSRELDFAPGLILAIPTQQLLPFTAIIDLPGRYVLGDKVFLTFGRGAVPITLSPDFALAITANGGVGYQLDKSVLVFGDLDVLTLVLAPDAAVSGPWSLLVLNGGIQYTPTRYWDVGALINVWSEWSTNTVIFSLGGFGKFRF